MNIAFVAAKSGGHLLPCLTKAQEFLESHPNRQVLFFSSTNELDRKIVSIQDNIHIHELSFSKLSLKRIWLWPLYALKFLMSCVNAYLLLKKHQPSKVVSMGGLISLPVCLAAKFHRIPIELYELNVIPGKAIRFLAPMAAKINVCFKETKNHLSYPCNFTNYPTRFKINQISKNSNGEKTIFILGGSQGSLYINKKIKEWIEIKKPTNIEIIHQIGINDTMDWKKFYSSHAIPAHTFTFDPNVESLYAKADLIICRSGAGTLFEIATSEIATITIPLETKGTNHQRSNAEVMSRLYPFITMIRQEEIECDKNMFFNVLNKKLHQNG